MNNEIQVIGLDIGRGYTKAYSEVNGLRKECLLKSVVGIGRNLDFTIYDKPIYIEVNNESYFAGILAEKEGFTATRNSKDSKTTVTVEKLIYAALNQVAIYNKVKIMLGVPYKRFKKTELNDIIAKYKDKKIQIKDKINGGYKDIEIVNISIFREGDAALMWEVKDNEKNNKPLGIATIGFRTTELSYFDKGLRFNDKRSKTIELGNKSALEFIQKELEKNNIIKEVNEIDGSNDYDKLKEIAYRNLSERISHEIEDTWINLNEMDIYIAGGTSLNMKFDEEFKLVEDPQMATAKGLYLVGNKVL
ncbi:ParM/StbA family protein [Clostridium tetani]|uniref:Actin-like protein N-terminal domain-containing protein n=1 Tax=Clostridium tetani TaxID=1513 RepID=A0ABY0ET35_CLOTA|nr:ParM/StbA family protein [Clostridium tetani]RXI58955.1 hypothetical protein DP131_00345 [Clostridium tetani]